MTNSRNDGGPPECSAVEGKGGGGAGTNYRGPEVRKGAPGPSMLHTYAPRYALVTLQMRVSHSDLV